MATHVYRITCTRNGVWPRTEVYYEASPLPAAARRTLRDAGWNVASRKVPVDAEQRRLRAKEETARRKAARLKGASSATHGFALLAGVHRELLADLINAAAGRGGLTT